LCCTRAGGEGSWRHTRALWLARMSSNWNTASGWNSWSARLSSLATHSRSAARRCAWPRAGNWSGMGAGR
jgi:hypothetical protein